MSVRRESRRLSRAFGALVLAMTPAAAAQACNESGSNDVPTLLDVDARNGDVITAAEGDVPQDAPTDSARPARDARCDMTSEMRDAGPDAAPDADPGCRYVLPCGLPDSSGFEIVGCGFLRADPGPGNDASLGCSVPEGNGCTSGMFTPLASGVITVECQDCFGGGGRRPAGLRQPGRVRVARTRSPLGAYFARMAHDEAASVRAFEQMELDLVRFGAPRELVDAAARSARDERRHARSMARQARACGSGSPAPRVRRIAPRSLEAIARENAVEGCIHETYGALQMRWQAANASDASLRRLFTRISADETRHAALSWSVARWADTLLDAPARRRVASARSRALRSLRAKLDEAARRAFDPIVGRPTPERGLALLDGMVTSLGV